MAVKLRQRSGKWWVFIDHHGKRKARCVGSKRAAQQVKAKIEAKLTLGGFEIKEEEKPVLFADYAKEWLRFIQARRKQATWIVYERQIRKHLAPLHSKALKDITRQDVKAILARMAESGAARGQVLNVLDTLKSLLSEAQRDGLIPANPAAGMGKDAGGRQERKVQFLTREELSSFLVAARQHFPGWYPLFLTLARTGLRLGEALALQWSDIDWHGGFIFVQRTFSTAGYLEDTPKSHKSRKVDVSPQLAHALRGLLERRKQEAWERGWSGLPEWVFSNEKGKPWTEPSVRIYFNYCLSKAGLRKIRVHDLRHTFASLLIQQGESLAYVRDQLGHHSIKITVDTYGHLVPGGNRQAVARLDDPEEATIRNPGATTTPNQVIQPAKATVITMETPALQ